MFRMTQHIARGDSDVAMCGKKVEAGRRPRWPRFGCETCLDLHLDYTNEVGQSYNRQHEKGKDFATRMDAARLALDPRCQVIALEGTDDDWTFIVTTTLEDDVDE